MPLRKESPMKIEYFKKELAEAGWSVGLEDDVLITVEKLLEEIEETAKKIDVSLKRMIERKWETIEGVFIKARGPMEREEKLRPSTRQSRSPATSSLVMLGMITMLWCPTDVYTRYDWNNTPCWNQTCAPLWMGIGRWSQLGMERSCK